MIRFLKGKIEFKGEKFLVIEAADIGYKVFCSPNTLKKVTVDQEIKIFTSLYLREDSAELYGFLSSEELDLFDVLNGISGIGPKTAMMLASLGSLDKLKEMMGGGHLPPEIRGIGQKRMQKILLELTGKIKELKTSEKRDFTDGALDALVSLGFPRQRVKEVLAQVPEDLDREEKIKKALKIIGRA